MTTPKTKWVIVTEYWQAAIRKHRYRKVYFLIDEGPLFKVIGWAGRLWIVESFATGNRASYAPDYFREYKFELENTGG